MPSTNTPPMRQSCDRCHRQKLRCTRTSNAGVCDRCLRKRVECVYSSCLPKGRPSLYRSTDEPTDAGTGLITPGSLTSSERSPPMPCSGSGDATTDAGEVDADVDAEMDAGVVAVDHEATDAVPALAPADLSKAEVLDSADASIDMSTGSWPYLQTLMGVDTAMDWAEGPPGSINWHAILDSPTCVDSTTFEPPSATAMARNRAGGPGRLSDLLPMDTCRSQLGGDGILDCDVDVIVSQLSQLTTRLGPLRRSCYALAKTVESSCPSHDDTQAHRFRLLDDAAFESVAAWLAHGVTPPFPLTCHYPKAPHPPPPLPLGGSERGGLLHDVLSASHHLLEIMHYLQGSADGMSAAPMSSATSSAGADALPPPLLPTLCSPSASLTAQLFASGPDEHDPLFRDLLDASIYPPTPPCPTSYIIRHLVIACHTLLLTIHVAMLSALQHDACQPSLVGTGALGQIRLVSVVQLCSYLIERQQQAVDQYLSNRSASSASLMLRGNHPGSMPLLASEDRETIKELEEEVQQRLNRLQQMLRI